MVSAKISDVHFAAEESASWPITAPDCRVSASTMPSAAAQDPVWAA